MTELYTSVLALKRLHAKVHLGVGDAERAAPQDIVVDVRFYMSQPPSAAHDDNGEYICYHGIAEKVHALCVGKEYRLIEYLAHEIYRLLRAEVPAEVKLWVKLHKLRILLPFIEDGASYIFSDLPAAARTVPE